MIDETVQMMDFGNGDEVYVTGGHVDLKTFLMRGGGVGSTWRYIPGEVVHGYLAYDDAGGLMYAGQEEPGDRPSFPVTCVVEPDNLPEAFKVSRKIH